MGDAERVERRNLHRSPDALSNKRASRSQRRGASRGRWAHNPLQLAIGTTRHGAIRIKRIIRGGNVVGSRRPAAPATKLALRLEPVVKITTFQTAAIHPDGVGQSFDLFGGRRPGRPRLCGGAGRWGNFGRFHVITPYHARAAPPWEELRSLRPERSQPSDQARDATSLNAARRKLRPVLPCAPLMRRSTPKPSHHPCDGQPDAEQVGNQHRHPRR